MTDKLELDYWLKVKTIRDMNLKVENVINENKKKEEDNRKVVKMIIICINNKDLLEGGLVIYKKNALLRCAMNVFFKYVVKTFKKYNKD